MKLERSILFHRQATPSDDDEEFGFAQKSQPKAKCKPRASLSVKKSQMKGNTPSKAKKTKQPPSCAEKESKAKEEAAEEALKKLDQVTAKCLWNKILNDREVGTRMSKAASHITELSELEVMGSIGVSALREQIETRLQAVELSKSLVHQLQNWSGELNAGFLLSTSFADWFVDLDGQLQQTVLMQMGHKLIEVTLSFHLRLLLSYSFVKASHSKNLLQIWSVCFCSHSSAFYVTQKSRKSAADV